ncbi:hypothetical protein Aperf_G00000020887 [Anoplocephala perfoliata]
MSETSAESPRVPPVRPPSCISMLAERLKCSNLQDTPPSPFDLAVDRSEARFVKHSTRRPKAVNFTNDEICDIIPIGQQRSSATSSDVDACDSGNEDCSESWTGGTFSLSSSSRVPEGSDAFSFGLNSSYQPALQHCLSTSAPDGPTLLFPPPDAGSWCDASAGERKSCCICQRHLDEATSIEDVPSQHQPPIKRSCRSQSASSNQKLSGGSTSRRTIARPIALRISQRPLYSPATSSNPSNLSSTAYALVASGCVKLRNANATSHQLTLAAPRLSWHHPIACGGGGGSSGNRRYFIHPGLTHCSRHSVVIGGSGSEFIGDVKLRKPPSLACMSTSTTSNPADFSHHRLSAFTPTTQSRRMSLSGDEPESTNSIVPYFSPDTVSSPCGGVSIGVPPHSTTVLPRPTVSAASSGFFQDSCSLSHSSCSSSTNSSEQHPGQVGNMIHHCGLSIKPSDDSTASLSVFDPQQQQQLHQQHHICSLEEAKLRCQSQPAGAAGAPACACGSVASVECLSRQVGLKRRRCSHEVGFIWETDSGAFLFGSHQHVGSSDGSSFNPDIGITNSETAGLVLSQETASVSPLRSQQPQQSEVVFPQESEAAFLMSCRRKELSGLSEASEEEESNEAAILQQQYPSCSALEEYDAGTLTPPPQTRFRPIAPATSPEDDDNEGGSHLHNHHNSCSTEGSPCSFKGNTGNIIISSEDGEEEDEVDDEDAFGAIAPGLNHRKRCSPMQTEEGAATASAEKFRELDIDMIEQD